MLADGTVLLPGAYSELRDCRIWDPETDMYSIVEALSTLPPAQGPHSGGAVLPDGRVVSRRGRCRTWPCGILVSACRLGVTWR
jgi:hypothetical protein